RFTSPRDDHIEFMRHRETVLIGAAILVTTVSIFAQTFPMSQADSNDALLLAQNSASAATTPVAAESPTVSKNVAVGTISAEPKPTPSQNVTINLIHRLVERGVLTKADADELIKQAEQDAATAREMAKQKQATSAAENELASQYFAEPTPIPQSAGATS